MGNKINKKELALDIALFVLSCVDPVFIYLYLFAMLFKMREGSAGFLKINMLYMMRQVFYVPGLATITGTQSSIKLILISLAAAYTLFNLLHKNNWKIPRYMGYVLLFGVVAAFSGVAFGSFPVAALAKVTSFTLVFIATVMAVHDCRQKFDVETYIYYWLSVIVFASLLLIPFEFAYLKGSAGLLFRGVWNHPNDFGVVCGIYMGMVFVRSKGITLKQLINLLLIFVMIFLSGSRGAMIIAAVMLVIYYFYCNNARERSVIVAIGVVAVVALFVTPLGSAMIEFFAKNNYGGELTTEAFSSRDQIIEVATTRFMSNPLFGRGLLISYKPGVLSFVFNEDGTEPGNIFLELLGGTGIVGLSVFLLMIWKFYKEAVGKRRIYTLCAVLASISEVSFFSVNNYAFLYYIVIAFSIFSLSENAPSVKQGGQISG